MRYKIILSGFLTSIIVIAIIAIYTLNTSQKIAESFKDGEKYFKTIATAATQVSSYSKRAEGHLFLYLALHRESDKTKFPQRIESLNKNIELLDLKIKNPKAREILSQIQHNSVDLLSVINPLVENHDQTIKNSDKFELEEHKETIFKLHEKFSLIRSLGVELAELEIKLEDDLKLEIMNHSKNLHFYMLVLIFLALSVTSWLGYILIKIINALKKEIANRIQIEKEITIEKDKLKQALSKVKVLSGLIPICASCKKIRDDKGYWNQIDAYIKTHSDVVFSHGICPECIKTLYPNLDED